MSGSWPPRRGSGTGNPATSGSAGPSMPSASTWFTTMVKPMSPLSAAEDETDRSRTVAGRHALFGRAG